MDNVLNEFLFDLYLRGENTSSKVEEEEGSDILTGKIDDMSFFPFICKLDDIKEVDNKMNWEKSNPMFHRPMSE